MLLFLFLGIACARAVRTETEHNRTAAPGAPPDLPAVWDDSVGSKAKDAQEHCSRYGRVMYSAVQRTRKRPKGGVTGSDRNRVYAELELKKSSSDFKALKKYFYKYMPKTVQLQKIIKVENRKLWPKYAGLVQGMQETNQLLFSHKCSPERWLWHGTDEQTLGMVLMDGFKTAFSSMSFNVYGAGLYFAPDPRLAHYFVRRPERKEGKKGAKGQVAQLILARVAVGETAEKDALGWSGSTKEKWMQTLAKPENRQPPHGFHSITSKEHLEVVTFQDNTAYPAYIFQYVADDLRDVEPYTDREFKANMARLQDITQDPFCRCPKSYKEGMDQYESDRIEPEA